MKFNISSVIILISLLGIFVGIIIYNHGSAAGFNDVKEQFKLIGTAIILENILILILGLIIQKKLSK
jgi:hypothetical protein